MKQHMSDTGIKFDCIAKFSFSTIPPWTLQPPEFIFDVLKIGSKSEIPPDVFKSKVNEILMNYNGYQRIYTNGSNKGWHSCRISCHIGTSTLDQKAA
jgi:hypothetical protein